MDMTAKTPAVASERPERRESAKTKSSRKKATGTPDARHKETKQDRVLTLLKHGTTITAIMQATGWQQHSVRGFFAGVVRKKLRLNLTSKKHETGRIYRIGGEKPSERRKAASRKAR